MPSYVVTGASRGIGLEFVRQLASNSDNQVFAIVRDKAAALAVPSSVLATGLPNIHVLEADVTNHQALKAAAAKVAEVTGGSLDVLINNAAAINGENEWRGITDFEGEDDVLEEEFDKAFKVNVMGVIYSTNSFLPLLRKGSTKKVVVISSPGGNRDFVFKMDLTGVSAYGITKAAVNMAVTKYALELKKDGFVVVALSPGLVDTSATQTKKKSPPNAAWLVKLTEKFSKAIPNFPGMVSPEVSVKIRLERIHQLTAADNGAFL